MTQRKPETDPLVLLLARIIRRLEAEGRRAGKKAA